MTGRNLEEGDEVMRRFFGNLLMVAAIVAIVTASPAFSGEPVHPTEVLRPTAFGVTPPLSEIAQQEPAEGIANYEIPNREV